MQVFRITHKKWSGKLTTSGLAARWNSGGVFVIYTAESRALACLENVIHKGPAEFFLPFIIMSIYIPDEVKILEINLEGLPAYWSKSGENGYNKCRPYGDNWILRGESAVLKVPSALVFKESNYLLNPKHPEFSKISITSEEPYIFDERLRK